MDTILDKFLIMSEVSCDAHSKITLKLVHFIHNYFWWCTVYLARRSLFLT